MREPREPEAPRRAAPLDYASLSRRELQAAAKAHGLKANAKSADIVRRLCALEVESEADAEANGEDEPADDRALGAPPPPPAEGTPLFMSLAAHGGLPTRPCDDVESLCYTLSFLAAGTLPWEKASRAATAELKSDIDADKLAADLPPEAAAEFATLWHEVARCRAAGAGALFDYAGCCSALRRAAAAMGAEHRGDAFDWERQGLEWTASGEIVDAQGAVVSARDISRPSLGPRG